MDDVKRKPITVTVPGAGLTVLRSLQKELSDLRIDRDRLKAENARLREALERIMRCTDDFCAEDVARAALKGSDK